MNKKNRSLETITGPVTPMPTSPPDISVRDPEGEIIECQSFDTPLMLEAKEVQAKKHKLNEFAEDGEVHLKEVEKYKDLLDETLNNINPDEIDCLDIYEQVINDNEIESVEDIETTATKAWSISNYVDLDENGKVIDQLVITPSEKRISSIENETNSLSFSKSTKQILVAGKKKFIQFGTNCKRIKFPKTNNLHFSRNIIQSKDILKKEDVTYDQHMMTSSVKSDNESKEEEELIFQKQENVSESYKKHGVELLPNQQNQIEEFLEEDATTKILKDSLADIVLKCEDLDYKIFKTKRKVKQRWRMFGQRKLCEELLKYEEARRNYGEVFNEMLTIIEKRGDAFKHF